VPLSLGFRQIRVHFKSLTPIEHIPLLLRLRPRLLRLRLLPPRRRLLLLMLLLLQNGVT
jgi:hypothetical protein